VTRFLYQYDKIVLELNALGDQTGRNVYGLNLISRTFGEDTFFYFYNGHADVTALLASDGTIAATYYYDAFGNILDQTGTATSNILYAGYQYDPETGLYYLNARMYDPVTARFIQEDTNLGSRNDPLSLNLYTYCKNSPIRYFDPTGHNTQEDYQYQQEMKEREDAKNAAIDKLTSNLSEKSLALASPGITLYDEYRWKYRKSAKEALIANGNKPTEHDIENLALKSFLNDYLVSQLQDPESAEPSIEGYIDSVRTSDNPFVSLSYGRAIRSFDTTVGMAVGFWDSIKNTGNAIGDCAWSMTSTGSSFVDAVQGNVTWDEFNTVLAQDNETRKSIVIGNYSGILDVAVGTVAGPLAMQEYSLCGSSFIQDGINGLTSAKDSGMIDICGVNAEEYMQAKSMATVEVAVITLADSLGAQLANSAAATPKTGSVVRNGLMDHEYIQAQEVAQLRGQKFVGNVVTDTPGIDGTMNGVNVSLKQYTGKSVSGVLTHASRAETSAVNAGYKGIDLYVDAKSVPAANLIDYANTGNLGKITTQGTISNIYVNTSNGWVKITNGVASTVY